MTLESGRKIKSVEKSQPGAQAERRALELVRKRLEMNARRLLVELPEMSAADKLRIFADLLDVSNPLTQSEILLRNAIRAEIPYLLGLENAPHMSTWKDLGGNVLGQGAPGAERHTNVGSLAEAVEAEYQGTSPRGGDTLSVPGLRQSTATGTLHIPRRSV